MVCRVIQFFRFYPQENGDVWCSTINNRFFIFNPLDYEIRLYEHNDILSKHSQDMTNDDLQVFPDGSIRVAYIQATGYLEITRDGDVTSELSVGESVEGDSIFIIFRELIRLVKDLRTLQQTRKYHPNQ